MPEKFIAPKTFYKIESPTRIDLEVISPKPNFSGEIQIRLPADKK